jgi:hypothetical protein
MQNKKSEKVGVIHLIISYFITQVSEMRGSRGTSVRSATAKRETKEKMNKKKTSRKGIRKCFNQQLLLLF